MDTVLTNRPALAPLSLPQVKEWLDYEGEALLRRRDEEIIPALDRTLEAYPYIVDGFEDAARLMTDNIKLAKALLATAETQRVENKAPYLNGGKAVDAWYRNFAEPIAKALAPLERILFDYSSRKVEEETEVRHVISNQSRVRGDYGAVASIKTVWSWEIEDFDRIPRHMLMVDPKKMKALAQKKRDPKTGKPLVHVPGIRWVKQQSLGVR